MTPYIFRTTLIRALTGLVLFPVALVSGQASAQSLGVCNSFYAAGSTLTQGKVNPLMPALAKPAKGTVLKEPSFGTCVVRATVHDVEPPVTFARNDYSRRQAFNADNTYFIVYSKDGWWHLYNATTLQYIRKLSPKVANASISSELHMAGDAEPQWHPTDPNSLYYLPTNGGTKLLKLDVRTNTTTIAADFAGKLPSWASNAVHIWSKSEGSPSADGRYFGFQVENSSFGLLGYMVWDVQNNRLVGSRQDSDRPDHSSMSAAGRWYVTSSDSSGTWAWSPDFTTKKKLHAKSEHSDLALGPNGQDYYVSVDYQSSAGDVFYTDIDACPAVAASATTAPVCPRTVLFPSYINGAATAMHFSGKGFSKPGWMVFSTYGTTASRDGTWPWFTNKIYVVELAPNPRVYPIAYTRRAEAAGGYWSEPHATVSRDFTHVAFNSNWGVADEEDIDTYIVHIPASSLPGTAATSGRSMGGNAAVSRGTSSAGAPVSSGAPVSTLVVPGATASSSSSANTNAFVSRGERLMSRLAAVLRIMALRDNRASVVALSTLPGMVLLDELFGNNIQKKRLAAH